MQKELIIGKIGNDKTVNFASEELFSYLKKIDNSCIIELRSYEEYEPASNGIIWVGLTAEASEHDQIIIDIKNGAGLITGSNERSVLMAVYRFLYELGCRFYRFDSDGELVPRLDLNPHTINVSVNEKASYKHRVVCIEGSVSYEHVYNIINWLPKVAMNGYYVQFQKPHTFFAQWSQHTGNPLLAKREMTNDDVMAVYRRLTEEIKKRGLMLHAVGHGWTCEPLGMDGNGWYTHTEPLSSETTQLLALTGGKRQLWNNIPLNTNLCYSNPKVRQLMTDAIVDYCDKNRSVDYLHFWLGDDKNNQCECEECKKLRPSDYYVMMLNQLDEKLTERGINTKIVFLIYYDLLWKALENKIINQDRFVLMFAPISRTYKTAFCDADISQLPPVPDYVRNQLIMPRAVDQNLAFLKSWQQEFSGDSFDFDYHLMWDHVRDFGYYECARILHMDMCSLDNIGLDGMVSCQIQRCAYPTNLPMYAMAKGLWNKNLSFDFVAEEYFNSEFGGLSDIVMKYLSDLSRLVDIEYIRKQKETINPDSYQRFINAIKRVEQFESIIGNIQGKSYSILKHHAKSTKLFLMAFAEKARGDNSKKLEYAKAAVQYIRENELELNQVLDVNNYQYVLTNALECKVDEV